MDKRQVYDWDTRIHLLARGPGIKKGGTFDLPATQVDIAPTFLGLAGLKPPPTLDGKSLLPLLLNQDTVEGQGLPSATKTHLSQLPPRNEYAASWRKAVLLEYYYNVSRTLVSPTVLHAVRDAMDERRASYPVC